MAGSYRHLVKDDDDGFNPASFTFETIENMGDAYEACEMCIWMIHWLAQRTFSLGTSKDSISSAESAFYHMKKTQ